MAALRGTCEGLGMRLTFHLNIMVTCTYNEQSHGPDHCSEITHVHGEIKGVGKEGKYSLVHETNVYTHDS